MKRLHSQHGYALLAVMGLLAMLIIYLAAVQGAVEITLSQTRLGVMRQSRAEAAPALIAMGLAAANGAPAQTLDLRGPLGQSVRLTRSALPATAPLWGTLEALRPLPGDELITLEWLGQSGSAGADRYLINRQGLRAGAIVLGAGEKTR
jgi:hypothetical protein